MFGKNCCCSKNCSIDVSCSPIVNIDLSSITIDVSTNPIINIDLSSITIDISTNPVINVDLSSIVIDNSGFMDNVDAFGRLRVSNPYTLFEFNQINGLNPLLIDVSLNGVGASQSHSLDSYVQMTVSGQGDSVIRQSHEYIPYQPGKSRLVQMTGVLYTDPGATSALTSRIGTFDASMGLFVQMQNGQISVVLRHPASSQTIPRAAWDDPLDGTGPSGVSVDFSKAQIYSFDMEWLGVGRVRCGIIQSGQFHYYYTFNHVNSLIAPYTPMAKLPLRYEITSTGSANSMRMICGTVLSEGGFVPLGREFIHGSFTRADLITIPVAAGDPLVPLIALRLRPSDNFRRTTVKIKRVDIFPVINNTWGSWKLLLNPTFATGSITAWIDYDTVRESAVQIATFDPTSTINVSGSGYMLAGDYFVTRVNSVLATTTDELVAAPAITTGLSDISDIIVLAANNLTTGGGGNSTSLLSNLQWIEIM
jgi:hypothetical protein